MRDWACDRLYRPSTRRQWPLTIDFYEIARSRRRTVVQSSPRQSHTFCEIDMKTKATGRPLSWWDQLVQPDGTERFSEMLEQLDFDDPAYLAGAERGVFKRFARRGVRVFFGGIGGSGSTDICRYDGGVEISVNNCVLPTLRRRVTDADEALIFLRATLCCDTIYRVEGMAPMVFNRPELTMVCLPKGVKLTIDGRGGCRQQGILGIFPPSALSEIFELSPQDLPPLLRAATLGEGSPGRIIALPLDHRVANLVADTIDTTLEGEMRALQYAGRLAELVAYALDAVKRDPGVQSKGRGVMRWRDADLAQLALERLSKDYRQPPRFDVLAKDLGTNANKLQASFKGVFGMTMAQYCLERRMREAQQLLLEGKLSVAEIADRVGYAHQSNFSAAFTAHVGDSPRGYRRHRAPISLELDLS
ncbi:helix-turn-helix domain-containing protein [Roseateles violae]|uniref:AraC family transcriptional regulator n=1 Tax=Roseateles violae TaxID=3058042 RepID=A0ABT8E077_9BURK|nr:AraC family transcriptional regulator [Pelomonas sp. PFR6]MDN3923200.1 AraC family transcriptional regulator [Pelomonas sp. PFR6]